MSSSRASSGRPTLPSIHSLDLPGFTNEPERYIRYKSVYNSTMAPSPRYPHNCHNMRNISSSSSNTSADSRTPSPCSSRSGSPPTRDTSPASSISSFSSSSTSFSRSPSSTHPPHNHTRRTPSGQVRLVPCSFADANAVIVVPSEDSPFVPPHSSAGPLAGSRPGQPLLLVGAAMQQYVNHTRHPQREASKGARVHPYRLVPSNGPSSSSSSRRPSVASALSLVKSRSFTS